jgi:hypothetical protein
MPLDSINRLNRVMEILRRQVAEDSSRSVPITPGRAPTTSARGPHPERAGVEQLRQRVVERVRALDPDDPRRPGKARRIFLESVLAWEFGDDILQDNRFDEMLTHIEHGFDAAPEMTDQLDELLAALQTRET